MYAEYTQLEIAINFSCIITLDMPHLQKLIVQVLPVELDEGEGGGWDKMWRGRGGGRDGNVHLFINFARYR